MTKTLLCLKGNFEARPVIERARALGHRVVLVDAGPRPACAPLADQVVVANHYDAAAVLAAFESEFDGLHYDGVLSCCGDTPHVAAALAARHDLPGLTPAQAVLSVDKLAQKTHLRAAGLPVPDFWLTEQALAGDRFPIAGLVVKPVDSRGARGVTWARDFEDIGRGVPVARRQSPTGRVMLEAFLPGPQLSTESIVVDGRVLFTAVALRNYDRFEGAQFWPHIIEDGCDAPIFTHPQEYQWVNDLLADACRALGWFQQGGGTVKGDLIVHDGKLVILELAARLSGGFLCSHTIPLAYGVPFVDYAIRLALGETVDHVPVAAQFVPTSQRYVFPAPGDIGRRVVSSPDVWKWHNYGHPAHIGLAWTEADTQIRMGPRLEGVQHATYAIRPGDVVQPVTSHGQRWGQAIATGATPERARARAEAAVKAMRAAVVVE